MEEINEGKTLLPRQVTVFVDSNHICFVLTQITQNENTNHKKGLHSLFKNSLSLKYICKL